MNALTIASKGLLRRFTQTQSQPLGATGKVLPASHPTIGSQYPKNTDVKHIRPALADRIDIALTKFPGRTALLFLSLAVLIVIVANVLNT